jgi:hypothetical protein
MENREVLQKQFARMGARVKIGRVSPNRWQREGVRIDVLRDGDGEYFDIRHLPEMTPQVIDVQPGLRHLVLLVRDGKDKNKFLCGHDERHWFAAAVPGQSVRSVETAIAALKPADVSGKFIRQGEWFFVPEPDLVVVEGLMERIHRREPLSRGAGSKPHICEEIYRTGGTTVMVNRSHPTGITQDEFNKLHAQAIAAGKESEFRNAGWMRSTRDAEVYARGYVRHSDHATVYLDGWHRVFLNNERFAPHARAIAFLD